MVPGVSGAWSSAGCCVTRPAWPVPVRQQDDYRARGARSAITTHIKLGNSNAEGTGAARTTTCQQSPSRSLRAPASTLRVPGPSKCAVNHKHHRQAADDGHECLPPQALAGRRLQAAALVLSASHRLGQEPRPVGVLRSFARSNARMRCRLYHGTHDSVGPAGVATCAPPRVRPAWPRLPCPFTTVSGLGQPMLQLVYSGSEAIASGRQWSHLHDHAVCPCCWAPEAKPANLCRCPPSAAVPATATCLSGAA